MTVAVKEGALRGALRATETRVRKVEHEGQTVEVPITVAQTRGGGFAFYQRGTGPFFSNREQRRAHFRGVEGHHDGSKRPTRGRVLREGNRVNERKGVRWVGRAA